MTSRKTLELVIEQKFDRRNCRHLLNGTVYVLHCHHFATLYSRLADDAEIFDGRALLRKGSEAAFLPELVKAFAASSATPLEPAQRARLAEDYFRFVGLGLVHFESLGPVAATVRMDRSHVDEGWVKKWGPREKPVNFIGQGFLAAAMAAIFDAPVGSFKVEEHQSIVAGAQSSAFTIVRQ